MTIRKHCDNRGEWLEARQKQGIGASEAAAIMGLSPWKTGQQLWEEKTWRTKPGEITGNSSIDIGNRMEPALREFFAIDHSEYSIEHYPFDILYQAERPWLFATLDGELTRKSDGAKGILEIKTATPRGKAGWAEWDGKAPAHYQIQVCHQMLATGWDYAIIYAALYHANGDITLRELEYYREDYEQDLKELLDAETRFYHYIQTDTRPPLKIRF